MFVSLILFKTKATASHCTRTWCQVKYFGHTVCGILAPDQGPKPHPLALDRQDRPTVWFLLISPLVQPQSLLPLDKLCPLWLPAHLCLYLHTSLAIFCPISLLHLTHARPLSASISLAYAYENRLLKLCTQLWDMGFPWNITLYPEQVCALVLLNSFYSWVNRKIKWHPQDHTANRWQSRYKQKSITWNQS